MGHSSSQYLNLKPGMGTDFSVPHARFFCPNPRVPLFTPCPVHYSEYRWHRCFKALLNTAPANF